MIRYQALISKRPFVIWGGIVLLCSLAVWLAASALFFGNEYGYFAPRGLRKSAILLPILIAGFALFVNSGRGRAQTSADQKINPCVSAEIRVQTDYFLPVAIISLLLLWLFPLPLPAFSAPHNLHLAADGPVEIRQIKYLDGTPVVSDAFQLTDGWQLSGPMPGGLVLNVRHNVGAGRLLIDWDGERTERDLSAPQSVTTEIVLVAPDAAPGLVLLVQGFYFLAWFCLIFIFARIVDARWPQPAAVKILLALLYIALFAIFAAQKFSYKEFSGERVFRDTTLYAETAAEPINSLDFWAGARPFTLPLFYKLTGVTSENYLDANVIHDVVTAQYWFSIISWGALALVFALQMRSLWLRPLAFGLILFFSLNLEIGIWESLLLSESISFSLFALLIAAWLWWHAAAEKAFRPVTGLFFLALTLLLTMLYIFTRESNQFFVVFGALLFPVAGLLGRVPRQNRKYYWAYLGLFLGVVALKAFAFEASDLWQIHMADLLARRILPDPRALDYFIAAGLPVNENLLQISTMPGHEYQPYLLSDPHMAAVATWINEYGVSTYAKYLLSHPIDTILAPLQQLPSILSGDNLEYHLPRYGVPTIPLWLKTLTARFYPRIRWMLSSFLGLASAGAGAYVLGRQKLSPPWLVIAVFVVSLYPLIFIVWHGNPLEIERHAAPVGIQFRLAGWMAVALLLDQIAWSKIERG